MDLRRQITILRAWLWLLVASVLLAACAAFLVSGAMPRVYEARNTLIVGQSLTAANPDYNQLLASQRLSQTYATVATTRPLAQHVITRLGLSMTADELLAKVRADAPNNSALIYITVSDTDPGRAADIANAFADELIAESPAIQGKQADLQAAVQDNLKSTQAEMEQTQSQIDQLAGIPLRTAEQDQELQTLQTRLVSLRSTYATLLQYLDTNSSNLLTVVEPAVVPTGPSSPRTPLNVILAAVLGLLAAVGIAFLVEYLDDSITSSDEVQEVTGLPTLGVVPAMSGDPKRSEIYRLQAVLYPRSAAAETYRTLRTNIEFASVDTPLRTVLVTSSLPQEGKTTTAGNLAVVFAQAGHRVLLVDADLRKPGVHRLFKLPNQNGLTTLFRDEAATVGSVAQDTEVDKLKIITTGALPPNPAELLGSKRWHAILERLKAEADLVILDSPPLQAVTDAALLATVVDGTLLVIRARHTRRGAVRQGYEALARSGGKILGVTMNRLKEREYDQYYYRYDSYYGDYYGKDGDGGGNGQAGDEVARQPQVPDGSPASAATLRPSRSGQGRDEAPSVSEQ
ncbi:MAG: polysaccharide biosynthesis tyrosine autokinase [Candidatus Limnocylindrales bacterium]